LNGEPISYLYCPVIRDVVLYDHLGYDPAYASLSPGTVLQILALQALFTERRFLMFDFTEGEGQHKEVFSRRSHLCGDVFVINRRIATLSVVMLHRAVDRTSIAAGAMLDRLGLKSRVRKFLRQAW
jgi:CelD/BcsL family acetyltransferase involved in cellulose biosynthesis